MMTPPTPMGMKQTTPCQRCGDPGRHQKVKKKQAPLQEMPEDGTITFTRENRYFDAITCEACHDQAVELPVEQREDFYQSTVGESR